MTDTTLVAAEEHHTRPWLAIVAATVLVVPLGSIYAFSVFLKPLEALLQTSRDAMATVFGIAAIFYTVGMIIGPRIYARLGIGPFLATCAVITASGVALAASAGSFVELALGYGLLFGIGGGLSYVAAQQGVNQVGFRRTGLVNGYVVALLPCGAMLSAPVFGWSIERFGVRETLWVFAGVLLATGLGSTALALAAGMRLKVQGTAPGAARERPGRPDVFWRLFVLFLLAAAAGLMVLSQAAGIVSAYGGATTLATLATSGLAGAIAVARLLGGYMIDRFSIPKVMAASQVIATAGGACVLAWPTPEVSIGALLAIGTGYGIVSGATAAAIAAYWPKPLFGLVAGRVYIAWCLAAVSLPILAARLFVLSGGYQTAFIIAGAANVAAALISLTLPRQSDLQS